MYICYIDESGHCGEKYNCDQPVEVLFGAMLDLTKLTKAQRQHNEILQIFIEAGIEISEFKASDMYGGRNQFSDFSPELRDALFSLLFSWGEDRYCKYFVSPIDSKKHFDLLNDCHPLASKFQFPFESAAMNIILAIQRFQKSKKKNKGRTFVVFDEQEKHDSHFIELFEQSLEYTDSYVQYDSNMERLDQIIDVPLFSKSHLATIIQLADIGAFVVRKYFELMAYGFEEKYTGELEKISEWYERIGKRNAPHTAINPPSGNDPLCEYFELVRPDGWSAREWIIG